MKKFTALALSAMLSVPILAQAGQTGSSPALTGAKADDLFTYVITSPAEGDGNFWSIDIEFPNATEVKYLPEYSDRPNYVEFKKNGQTYTHPYSFLAYSGNSLSLEPGGYDACSTDDRWEVILQPGLFALLDENENTLGENPLMEIVVTEGLPVGNVDFSFTGQPQFTDDKLLLTELTEIKLTFTNLDKVTAEADAAVITLGNSVLDRSDYTVTTTENVLTVAFNPAVTSTADATLSVTFAEGTLTGTKDNTTDTNKTPVTASYNIVPPAVYDLTIDFYDPKPDGEGNIALSKFSSMLFFACDDTSAKAGGGSTPNFTLKEVNGDFETSAKLTFINGYAPGKSAFYAMFGEQPVYNGAYTLTLAKGSIGDARWQADHSMGHSNDEVVLTFNITGGEDRPVSDPFAYVVTKPSEGDETFYEIHIQFPEAADLQFIPEWAEWSSYVGFRMNGQTFNPSYAYHGKSDNTLTLDLGGIKASVDDRWEVTIQPGLFRLLDTNENSLGENPLMEIVVTEGQPVSKVDFTNTSEPVSADPYDETMLIPEVSEIKLTFPNLDTVTVENGATVITLGETTLDKSAYTVTATGADNVVRIAFDPVLTSTNDKGLTITFPTGSLSGKKGHVSDSNQTNVENRYYTVVPATAYDLTIDFYQPAPDADGNLSVNKSLAMAMFICDTPNIKVGGGSDDHITLREVNGDFECSGRLTTLTGMVSGKSTFYASFDQPVYNGEYTVTLSRGAIGDDRWRLDHSIGHTNDEVVLRFNIVDGETRPVGPHIDLSVTYTATEAVAVTGVPSEDNIYWYANIIETSRYPGDAEMLESAINFFKFGAETFGMDWITVYQMTAKTGEHTWGFGDLYSSTDYTVYAFGLDGNGNLYMPLTKINVRTADQAVSDNTFTLDVLSVDEGTETETKKVTLKVTPTNDDPYAVVILDKYLGDNYDLTDPTSEKNYLRNVLRPLVTPERVYTGAQTVVFDNVKIDAVMQAAVFGYENYETTPATIADFSTVDDNFEAVTVMAYDPTISGASATIYSFDMVRPFITGVISKESADAIGGIENIHENYRVPYWEAAGMGYYDWRYFATRDLKRQALDGRLSDILGVSALKWETEYYVYAYLMDEGGYRTSPVFYDTFTTDARNQGNNTFELTLNSMTSNAPYAPDSFTADMTIIPSDKEGSYALYYGETYGFEEYLAEDRVDDWMYDVFMQRKVKRTYTGDLNFGYGSVYPDKSYILIVTGFDEAPNTAPTWMLFNKDGIYKDSWSGINTVAGDSLRIYVRGHDICLDGEFTDAAVYTTDGLPAGSFKGNVCRVDGSGCYIVRVQTARGTETRKIAVR